MFKYHVTKKIKLFMTHKKIFFEKIFEVFYYVFVNVKHAFFLEREYLI